VEEITKEDVRREIANYVKSNEFKSVVETQYRDLLRPTVYGCSISYDMSGVKTGRPPWVWGYTSYDNGGFHSAGRREIIVPKGFSGLYLILAEAAVTPTGSPAATSLDIDVVVVTNNVVTSGGSTGSTRSFGASVGGPLDWTSNNFLELDEGDAIYLAGGTANLSEQWTCPILENHLAIIKFPFGS
jgi:hypothetical protein